ncbi:hypothetical protein ACOSQ4_029665 [Xanthoceras sorbifolium]
MQVKHSQDVETAWRKCADNPGLAQAPIDNCYNSGEETKLSLGYVNNVAVREDFPNYIRYVCKAYKDKPIKACKSHLSSTLKETSVHPVCYGKQTRNRFSQQKLRRLSGKR